MTFIHYYNYHDDNDNDTRQRQHSHRTAKYITNGRSCMFVDMTTYSFHYTLTHYSILAVEYKTELKKLNRIYKQTNKRYYSNNKIKQQ